MVNERRIFNYPVAEISPASSSNKRKKTKATVRDRLSQLPDSLLICILSFLGVKEAAKTCLLSRRWQYLWTCLPRLQFKGGSLSHVRTRKFVDWVNRTLVICGGNHLEKFEVELEYDSDYASDVNVWLEFIGKNKVKDVDLKLHSDPPDDYLLPQMIYFNSYLTTLSLQGCVLHPRGTVKWASLKTLHLERVELCENAIAKILSGCPVLYHLSVKSSWGDFFLECYSQSLRELVIVDDRQLLYANEEDLQISAPYVEILKISLSPFGNRIQVDNISSVVEAHIDFCFFDNDDFDDDWMDSMRMLFESILHVKKLVLGPECIELLSMLVVNGWQLPRSTRGILTVNAWRRTEIIPGIIGLLESSPDLESLVINSVNCPYEIHFTQDPTTSYFPKDDVCHEWMFLKTVTITAFMTPNLAGDWMLKVVQILLRRAKVLEKMVIKEMDGYSPVDYMRMAQTLLSYPRSSTKAVIDFS